jgi:mRNA interferase HicA
MNSNQFKAWLRQQGCTFETKLGRSGHLIVRLGSRKTDLPMHGGGKELGTGLVSKIKKDLGLK